MSPITPSTSILSSWWKCRYPRQRTISPPLPPRVMELLLSASAVVFITTDLKRVMYYRGLSISLRYAIDYDREHCRWLTVTKYVYLFIQATEQFIRAMLNTPLLLLLKKLCQSMMLLNLNYPFLVISTAHFSALTNSQNGDPNSQAVVRCPSSSKGKRPITS